ncbi:MMPL family transporter [Janibacter cremeus]|uniref:RND superfamily putative drug exporter n=1 Tax=Janibacter cremeus TaxID=1285192 RepID=A0A852W087_9MICO|nr:MMPL family transporter [Janibacter cremeus]NYF99395.1 RND superfamily putative drug exporter [Janibacter cremeus]
MTATLRPHRPDSPPPGPARSPAARLTGRRGAAIVLVLALVVIGLASTLLGSTQAPPRGDNYPSTAESALVAEQLDSFPDSDQVPVLLVATKGGNTLSDQDVSALDAMAGQLPSADAPSPARVSQDGEAAVITLPVTTSADSDTTVEKIATLRSDVADHTPSGMTVEVTGGPAFGADITSSFDGANFTLLAVTIGVVALLLLLTYRSPVLWLVPLLVVGIADQLAGTITTAVGDFSGLPFDAGIVSVLVFGAGANYALLLISRYREELHEHEDHRAALAAAWRATVPAILASNATVVLALGTLLLASVPGTRGLGLASAVGLVIALLAITFVLPAALALVGRKVFWPFIPRPGDDLDHEGLWAKVARRVVARPAAHLVSGLVLLAVLASGLFGASIGLSQADSFRTASESADGLVTVGEHFPAGAAAPFTITTDTTATDATITALEDVDGVTSVHPTGTNGAGLTQLTLTGEPAPGSPASLDLAMELREAAHGVTDANARVGGGSAELLDARTAAESDLSTVVPLVLLVSLAVLALLLRAVIGPLVLLALNAASALAALGLGAWLDEHLLGHPALDVQVPLVAFLFLVALGIDYTIFLMHRARAESAEHGTREGVARAVARTGAVITSAGIVLAAVFAALGVLPLVVLGQLGLIVGLGVLLDTLIVRTVIVPAATALIGDRFWWPSRPSRVASRS